jgi:hypothetical protein
VGKPPRFPYKGAISVMSVLLAGLLIAAAVAVLVSGPDGIGDVIFTIVSCILLTILAWDFFHTAVEIRVSADTLGIRKAKVFISIPWNDIKSFRVTTVVGVGQALFKLKPKHRGIHMPIKRFYVPFGALSPDHVDLLKKLIVDMESYLPRERSLLV